MYNQQKTNIQNKQITIANTEKSEGKKKFNALAWMSVNIQDLNKEAFHFHDHFSKVSFSLGKTAKNLTVFLEYIIRTMFTI